MNVLLEKVMGSIDGSVVQQLAARMGVSPDEAQGAIGSAMPALLAGIGQHAGTSGGANAVHDVAQQLQAGNANGANMQGMLGQVFADQQGAQGLAAATGLPQEHAEHMLSVLGPVILTAIGQHTAQTGVGAQELEQVLGAAAQHAQSQGGGFSGLLGSLFGQN
ncbi:MAG TPA: DUF937 domain-containing protein [Xanthomonadaceae bacterium]|jgi:hypothetical protein|nr:DUF937 domain-containing protein [Xanthomonadaceae bacterium]